MWKLTMFEPKGTMAAPKYVLDLSQGGGPESPAGGSIMKRIFLAALLGAIAMFIWTSIAHMALPLGEAGIREIPNEVPDHLFGYAISRNPPGSIDRPQPTTGFRP